jgi:hypothetical protein
MIVILLVFITTVKAEESLKQKVLSREGLIGTYFNSDDFERPETGMIDIVTTIDYDWGGGRGSDWSARWSGFIEGPVTGRVGFIVEARDGFRLTIGSTVVIDGLEMNGPRTGTVNMTKGKKEPIRLEFTSSSKKALLRLFWEWSGTDKHIIPTSALSHSTDKLPEEFMVFDFDKRPSEQSDNNEWLYPADEFPVGDIDLCGAKIVVLNPSSKVQANAADMLHDQIEKRTRIGLDVVTSLPGKNVPTIVIGLGKQVTNKFPLSQGLKLPSKADGYALWIDKNKRNATTVCLAGVDDRGALFAAGRLLRVLKMSRDRVGIDDGIKIATAPTYSLRGHQFGYRPKTNSYDGWTIEMWEQYYHDMIAFGMNAIELIPPRRDDADDSPHFPKSQLEMMVDMSQLAADYGLDVWIWFPAIDDDYTDEQTVNAALLEWGEVFRNLPKIDVVFVPGGDPGDTHPAILLPFMEKQKKNLNKYHLKAQIWVSPQGFDRRSKNRDGWLKAFLNILQNDGPEWLDGVVFGPQVEMSLPELRKAVPAKYPIRRYPDITHCRSSQYAIPNWDDAYKSTLGREPINPRPRAYAKIFRDLQQYSIGFITYSEGCNDDFNKVLWSCLGWYPDMKVEEIAKEYSRYFISPRWEEKFAQGLLNLEQNIYGRTLTNKYAYETLRIFQEMEKNALPQERLNWRFQQGLYRAYYDAYIKARLEDETELKKQALEVLKQATTIGSPNAIQKAEAILDKARTNKVKPEWRARVFELAEALFQSIRMQLSVKKYQAIRVNRGANLDNIDKPLLNLEDLKQRLDKVYRLKSEKDRLEEIAEIID